MCSASPSLWALLRRASIKARSAGLNVKKACSSKPLMSRGSSRMPRYVVCQPCIARLTEVGRARYASEK